MKRADLLVLLGVYVLPLAVVAALLVAAGLPGLAVALLVVEAVVVAVTVLVRRRPPPDPARPPTSRPWLVPLVMVLLLAGVVGLASLVAGRG